MRGSRITIGAALGAGAVLIAVASLPRRYDCLWYRLEAHLRSPGRTAPRLHVPGQIHDLGVRSREPVEHAFEIHNDGAEVLEILRVRTT